jgi:hypothetical protein
MTSSTIRDEQIVPTTQNAFNGIIGDEIELLMVDNGQTRREDLNPIAIRRL